MKMRRIFPFLILLIPLLVLGVSAVNWTYSTHMIEITNNINVSNGTYMRLWMNGGNNTFYMLDWVNMLVQPWVGTEVDTPVPIGLWLYFGIWITNVAVIWMRTRDIGIPFLIVLFTCIFIPAVIPPETMSYIYLLLAVLGAVILWGVVKGGRD